MFCNWCGKKIVDNVSVCPSCGKEQGTLENGNGFWDLCGLPDGKSGGKDSRMNLQGNKMTNKDVAEPKKKKTPKNVLVSLLLVALLAVTGYSVWNSMILNESIQQIRNDMVDIHSDFFEDQVGVNNEILTLEEQVSGLVNKVEHFESVVKDFISKPTEPEVPPVIGDEKSEEEEYFPTSFDTTDDMMVTCTPIDSDSKQVQYELVGNVPETCKLYWQSSTDSGETWQTVEEDTLSCVSDSENKQYRVICHTITPEYINFELLEDMLSGSSKIEINKKESGRYLLNIKRNDQTTDNLEFVWQKSDDGLEWNDYLRGGTCEVDVSRGERYRLAIYTEYFYCLDAQSK